MLSKGCKLGWSPPQALSLISLSSAHRTPRFWQLLWFLAPKSVCRMVALCAVIVSRKWQNWVARSCYIIGLKLDSNWIMLGEQWENKVSITQHSSVILLAKSKGFCSKILNAVYCLYYIDIPTAAFTCRTSEASPSSRHRWQDGPARDIPRLKPRYYSEIEEIHIWLALL